MPTLMSSLGNPGTPSEIASRSVKASPKVSFPDIAVPNQQNRFSNHRN